MLPQCSAHFPKSKIRDVRFPGAESEDGLDLASAEAAALENPDNFENDDDDDDDINSSATTGDPGAGGLDDYFN